MKLRGKIFGSFELVEFNLMDVVGYRNGCIMVSSDDLEAPIVYDTIEPAWMSELQDILNETSPSGLGIQLDKWRSKE